MTRKNRSRILRRKTTRNGQGPEAGPGRDQGPDPHEAAPGVEARAGVEAGPDLGPHGLDPDQGHDPDQGRAPGPNRDHDPVPDLARPDLQPQDLPEALLEDHHEVQGQDPGQDQNRVQGRDPGHHCPEDRGLDLGPDPGPGLGHPLDQGQVREVGLRAVPGPDRIRIRLRFCRVLNFNLFRTNKTLPFAIFGFAVFIEPAIVCVY